MLVPDRTLNHHMAQAFAGGWFHTGDQGFLDGDGFLTLTGRIKELINRGGEKISPLEVRQGTMRLPCAAQGFAGALVVNMVSASRHSITGLQERMLLNGALDCQLEQLSRLWHSPLRSPCSAVASDPLSI